jgi:hypothetical protein
MRRTRENQANRIESKWLWTIGLAMVSLVNGIVLFDRIDWAWRLGICCVGLGEASWGLRAWIGRRHTNEIRRKSNEGEIRNSL